MGSKRIKAIVAVGRAKPAIYDTAELGKYASTILQEVGNRGFPILFKKYGTSMFLNALASNAAPSPLNELFSVPVIFPFIDVLVPPSVALLHWNMKHRHSARHALVTIWNTVWGPLWFGCEGGWSAVRS